MNHTCHTVLNGIGGIAASGFAVITTFQEQLEWWVRMASAGLGMVVAIITIYNLLKQKP